MIVLLLALGVAVYSAWTMNSRYTALNAANQARVDAAQSELDASKAAYAAIDPSTDEGMARQIEAENQAIADAQQQTEALHQKSEQLRQENEELRAQVAELEADEENAYYLTVYESLHKGMEMVEGYIDGNE